MQVVVSADTLACFRRRTLRRYPREYMETIWGRMIGKDIHIFAFHPIDHEGSRFACNYWPSDLSDQHDDADEQRLELLGTIHSHPDGSSSPSEDDWETAVVDGEIISGICQILRRNGRRRCRVKFYSGKLHQLRISKKIR